MNGDCHDLNSFITSGLKIDVLRNFVDRIKILNPTDPELAVLAALALFSPGYRDTNIPPEDSLLLEEYQVTSLSFRVIFGKNIFHRIWIYDENFDFIPKLQFSHKKYPHFRQKSRNILQKMLVKNLC